MMRGATVFQLGSLTPEQENPLKDMLGQIDALEQEALFDMHSLSDMGVNTSSYQAEYDAFVSQSSVLRGEFTTLDDNHIASWQGRANAVVLGLTNLMGRLEAAKQGGLNLSGEKGLLWGLGVAVAVAGISYAVWTRKARRRKRAR